MKLSRLVWVLFLMVGWAAAQCGPPATTSDDKSKKDSSATAAHKDGEHKGMSCGCCKNMGKKDADHKDAMQADDKDAAKSADKDAAKSEAKSEGAKSGGAKSEGMMAGGMGCCAGMGKDKDKAGAGMKCGGSSDSKAETLPDQKMK